MIEAIRIYDFLKLLNTTLQNKKYNFDFSAYMFEDVPLYAVYFRACDIHAKKYLQAQEIKVTSQNPITNEDIEKKVNEYIEKIQLKKMRQYDRHK